MFSSVGSLFIMPACYHPTTVMLVDDDETFLSNLSMLIADKLPLLLFSDPEKAIAYIKKEHHNFPFTSRCLIENEEGIKLDFMAIRNEIYNPNRFKEIVINITDYDMPYVTGNELIETMHFPREIPHYSHILLTGKSSTEFQSKINTNVAVIRKDDPDYINKVLKYTKKQSAALFQWFSYVPSRILSRNPKERSYFLFDGNFMQLFNAYIQENHICELYLFDKQGSYLFLDESANLSWLFVRNPLGIENTINHAKKYGAPTSVIHALEKKEKILSLYEVEDIERRKKINWDDYLLPATLFESNSDYLGFFSDLIPNVVNNKRPIYYYAFTKIFPDHGIKKENIVSYKTFLADYS